MARYRFLRVFRRHLQLARANHRNQITTIYPPLRICVAETVSPFAPPSPARSSITRKDHFVYISMLDLPLWSESRPSTIAPFEARARQREVAFGSSFTHPVCCLNSDTCKYTRVETYIRFPGCRNFRLALSMLHGIGRFQWLFRFRAAD